MSDGAAVAAPREEHPPFPVRFRSIALAHFRNYESLRLDLPARHIVLAGHNGAGKTNLLEAFSLFAPGRGLRRAAYDAMARIGGPGGFAVGGRVEGPDGDVQLGTGVGPVAGEADGSRRLKIDGVPAATIDRLNDHVRLTWLTPAMDGLFTGAAGDRRRFLDRLVLAVHPGHGAQAIAYEKAMRQRNRLLADQIDDPAWHGGLEAEMARAGAAIALARADVVAALNRAADTLPDDDGFPLATLALEGGLPVADGDMEEALTRAFRASRRADLAAGRALVGPHRTDLVVTHRAKAMPAELASTGEQKALLAGLVLGHARLIAATSGMSAVLLLDEIGAHFDESRRAALFDILDGMDVQAIMTGTEASLFEALGSRAAHLAVRGGRITSDE